MLLPITKPKPKAKRERASEFEWLKWFHDHAHFGIHHNADTRLAMKMEFMRHTGKNLPEGYNDGYFAGEGETNLDNL